MQFKNPVLQFQLGQFFSYFYFWLAIAIPYLVYRDLTLTQAITLISFYQLSTAILEYPTGVVADYFGHKISLSIGHLIQGIGILFMAVQGPIYQYYFTILIMGIGGALSSGSDIALLKSISKSFKRDLANYEITSHISLIISALLSGLVVKISYEFALIITFLTSLLSAFTILTIKANPHERQAGNIFSAAKEGIKVTFNNKTLLAIMFFLVFLGGYIRSIKTIWGGFFELKDAEISLIGVAVAFGVATRIIGFQIGKYTKGRHIKYFAILTGLLFLATALSGSSTLIAGLLFATTNLTTGLLLLELNTQVSEIAPDEVRASVFSLNSLVMRLFMSAYLFMSGVIMEKYSFEALMTITLVIFIVTYLPYTLIIRKIHINPKA